jgi:hypothetical protein
MYDPPPKKLTRSPYLRNINNGEIHPWHEVLAAKSKEWAAHWEHPPRQHPKTGEAMGMAPQYDRPPPGMKPIVPTPAPRPASGMVSPFEHPANIAAMPDDPTGGDPLGTDDFVEGTEPALDAAQLARQNKTKAPRTRKAMPEADFFDHGGHGEL